MAAKEDSRIFPSSLLQRRKHHKRSKNILKASNYFVLVYAAILQGLIFIESHDVQLPRISTTNGAIPRDAASLLLKALGERKPVSPRRKNTQLDGRTVRKIICLTLILSGNIHPNPGPITVKTAHTESHDSNFADRFNTAVNTRDGSLHQSLPVSNQPTNNIWPQTSTPDKDVPQHRAGEGTRYTFPPPASSDPEPKPPANSSSAINNSRRPMTIKGNPPMRTRHRGSDSTVQGNAGCRDNPGHLTRMDYSITGKRNQVCPAIFSCSPRIASLLNNRLSPPPPPLPPARQERGKPLSPLSPAAPINTPYPPPPLLPTWSKEVIGVTDLPSPPAASSTPPPPLPTTLPPPPTVLPGSDNDNGLYTTEDMEQLFSARGLHIIHLNVNSLKCSSKMSEIRSMFGNGKVGILSFSETKLDDSVSDSEIEIKGYSVIRKDRDRFGGGVCIYVRTNINFNVLSDLGNNSTESVWVKIIYPKAKPLIIGAIYRPPDQNAFYDLMEEYVTGIGSSELILLGDANTNVLRNDSPIFKSYSKFCNLYSLTQLIKQLTRPASQTIIDLILTSDQDRISKSGVIECSLSDHNIIFCTRKIHRSAVLCHTTIKCRSMKHYSSEALTAALEKMDWSDVLDCSSAEETWSGFKSGFLSVLDGIAPTKVVRVRARTEPWMKGEILNAIKIRNKSYSKYNKNKNEQLLEKCRKLRNIVNNLISKAKKNFINENIEVNKKHPEKLWEALNQLGCSNKLQTKSTNFCIISSGSLVSDKLVVANCFNSFFTTIATLLVSKLPPHSGLFGSDHIQAHYEKLGAQKDAFSFKPVKTEDVLEKLIALQPNKATGHDNIPTRFLRDAAGYIAPIVTHITNLSISQCHVPQEFKLARVIPLYKKGSKLEPVNYRPVSILCSISKVIERLIHEQIYSYLDKRKLLFEFQSGFRTSHSTDTCLLYLNDYIKREVDSGKFCGMVMLDLQKAFDTVNHSILLVKLKAIGFDSTSINWMKSYLEDREQVVDINGTMSSSLPVNCGVPQGSILGPLLFLLYINDMNAACNCKLFLFADDSALLISGEDKLQVEEALSSELTKIRTWLSDNKLSLHLGKTESILFGSKHSLSKVNANDFKVRVDDIVISSKEEITYLGCILDNKLTGESMATRVIKRVNQRTRFLGRISSFVNKSALRTLAGALIQPFYDYASTSWYSNISVSLKTKLQTSQNKLIRLLLGLGPMTHLSSTHFDSLGWLRVEDRVKQLKMGLTFKIVNAALPSMPSVPAYLTDYLKKVSDTHNHNTRGSENNDLVPPTFKTNMGKFSFYSTATQVWNALTPSLKKCRSLASFKSRLKIHLSAGQRERK